MREEALEEAAALNMPYMVVLEEVRVTPRPETVEDISGAYGHARDRSDVEWGDLIVKGVNTLCYLHLQHYRCNVRCYHMQA